MNNIPRKPLSFESILHYKGLSHLTTYYLFLLKTIFDISNSPTHKKTEVILWSYSNANDHTEYEARDPKATISLPPTFYLASLPIPIAALKKIVPTAPPWPTSLTVI